ncbi:MAG: extracellular solute-binding protein [Acidimicrobiia bacterium]|nr:extracellular solute-binding protein [Acidimicrobiia bacterium]
MQRRWLAACLAALVLAVGACGGDDGSEATDTTGADGDASATTGTEGDTSATTGAEGESGAATGSIEVVHAWTGSEGEAFEAVAAGFEEANPEATVELIQIPFGEMSSQLTQQFAAGSAPDVMTALPGLIRLFAEQDFLQPMDAQWDTWVEDGQYNEALRTIATAEDGVTYGVWFKGNVNGLVWYRPSTLEELGVEVPETWADWEAALQAAADAGMEPVAVGGADQWPLTQWSDPFLLRIAGIDAFQGLIDGTTSWDDPAVVSSFEGLGQFISDYFPDNALDRGFVEATCAWVRGDAAFLNQGAFVNLVAPAECDESLVAGEDFTFFHMPAIEGDGEPPVFISGDLFVVNAESDAPELATAFATYLGSAEAQTIWAEQGGYIAPNADVAVDVYPNENDARAAELWPSDADAEAGYDLDDFIGGEVQATERAALQGFVQNQDVEAFIGEMTSVAQSVQGG